MVFGSRVPKDTFMLLNEKIEQCRDFKYLGIIFSDNRRFFKAMKNNINKARRGFCGLIRNGRNKHLPIDCLIEIFTKTIDPILLYGSEIYGQENPHTIESFRLKCLRTILKVKSTTPSYMVLAETGLVPIEAEISKRLIGF